MLGPGHSPSSRKSPTISHGGKTLKNRKKRRGTRKNIQ